MRVRVRSYWRKRHAGLPPVSVHREIDGPIAPGLKGESRVLKTLSKQAWCPTKKGEVLELEGASRVSGTGFKPREGKFLWTSTWTPDKKHISEWHVFAERQLGQSATTEDCFVLVPKKNLRIYEIDKLENLVWLVEHYFDRDRVFKNLVFNCDVRSEDTLDWEEIADDFDAVHLTSRGQKETRYSRPGLYGWDTESTVWLHPDVSFEGFMGGAGRRRPARRRR